MSARRFSFSPKPVAELSTLWERETLRNDDRQAAVRVDREPAAEGKGESVLVTTTSHSGRWAVDVVAIGETLDDAMTQAEAKLREVSPRAFELYASIVLVGADAGQAVPL